MKTVTLNHDGWSVVLAPQLGAALLSCEYEGQNILRAALEEKLKSGRDLAPSETACFLMVPFSNRIENGQFSFGGRDITLPRNKKDRPHPQHGYGRLNPWDVCEVSASHAVMSFDYARGNWPWSFSTQLRVNAAFDTLTMTLSLENTDDTPMPGGLGFHPYFPDIKSAALSFKSGGVWQAGPDVLPVRWEETPKVWGFEHAKPLRGLEIDNCFTGWDGRARIAWANKPVHADITCSPEARFAVLYTQNDDNYFCFEPATHMNNGVNWEGREETGVATLAPGERMQIEMSITAQKNRE